MGSTRPKQFLTLAGRPLLAHTLAALQGCPEVESVFVAVPAGQEDFCRREVVEAVGLDKVKAIIQGGPRRQDSVKRGLEATQGAYEWILVHDGVRPLVSPRLLSSCIREAQAKGAATAALPARETVKEVDSRGRVVKTLPRERLWMVQTPQVFRYKDLWRAHQRALDEGWPEAADDAALVERLGVSVHVVEGSEQNIKITTPVDLAWAEFLLSRGKA